jgi:hypothetical protein
VVDAGSSSAAGGGVAAGCPGEGDGAGGVLIAGTSCAVGVVASLDAVGLALDLRVSLVVDLTVGLVVGSTLGSASAVRRTGGCVGSVAVTAFGEGVVVTVVLAGVRVVATTGSIRVATMVIVCCGNAAGARPSSSAMFAPVATAAEVTAAVMVVAAP